MVWSKEAITIDLQRKKFSVFADSKNNLPNHAKQHETPKITLTFGKRRATLAAQGVQWLASKH